MDFQQKCEVLADEIKKILSRGIVIDSNVACYIDTTFSNPTVAELEAILNDDCDCEKDPLLELIFFPDESMQLQLEELLQALRLDRRAEQRVLDCLCSNPLPVRLHFADGRGSLEFLLSEELAGLLLSRLRIHRHLDSRLREALNNFGDQHNLSRLKVKIRNSRFASTPGRLKILCTFLEKYDPADKQVMACFDFLLEFIEALDESDDPFRALMARKKFHFLNLQKAARLARRLQRTNMETFMLQGRRVALIDPADARLKMQLIDRISQALFGKSKYFEPPGPEEQISVRLQKNALPENH